MITPCSAVSSNNTSFKGAYHTYFFTTDGRRIVSDENMKKCLHYVEAHLNNSKRVKEHNKELIETMKFGNKLPDGSYSGGDYDYYNIPKIRAVFDSSKKRYQGFVSIITGHDVDIFNNKFGKPIGKAKRVSRERTGSMYSSFETCEALKQYNRMSTDYVDSHAVYKDGKRQAFGVYFTPVYNKKGNLKGFEYNRSGFFDEK